MFVIIRVSVFSIEFFRKSADNNKKKGYSLVHWFQNLRNKLLKCANDNQYFSRFSLNRSEESLTYLIKIVSFFFLYFVCNARDYL